MAVGRQVYITGMGAVLANMNREILKIKGRTRGGMQKAVLLVQQITLPLTPKKTGTLRKAMFTRVKNTASGPVGIVGFRGVGYAIYVHEIKKAHYNIEGTGWKFLERALKVSERHIIEIIRKNARIR